MKQLKTLEFEEDTDIRIGQMGSRQIGSIDTGTYEELKSRR